MTTTNRTWRITTSRRSAPSSGEPGAAGSTGRLMLGGAMLLASCGAGTGAEPDAPPRLDESSTDAPAAAIPVLLVASITPGKPSAPTESIELRHDGGTYRLRVSRRHVDGTVESGEAALEPADVERLAGGPLNGALAAFSPDTIDDPVPDFGLREVRVQRDTAGTVESWSWDRMLRDERPATTLFRELAVVARERVPDVLLAYFPR